MSPSKTKQSGQNTTSLTPRRSKPASSARRARSTTWRLVMPGEISASNVSLVMWLEEGPVPTVASCIPFDQVRVEGVDLIEGAGPCRQKPSLGETEPLVELGIVQSHHREPRRLHHLTA